MRDYSSKLSIYFYLINLLGITIIFFILYLNKFGGFDVINPNYLLLYILSFANFFLLSVVVKTPHKIQLSHKNIFFKLLYAFIPFSAFVFGLSFIFKSGAFSRKFVFLFMTSYFIFLILQYFLFNFLIRKNIIHLSPKRILIIGAGKVGERLYKELRLEWLNNIEIIGFLDDDENNCIPLRDKIIGHISQFETILKNRNISEVYITIPLINEDKVKEMIQQAELYGIKTRIVPNYYRLHDMVFSSYYLGKIPIINISDFPLENEFNQFIKRLFDIFFSFFTIILITPVLIVFSILIKLTSKGPVFFNPIRVGLSRKEFKMYKFRSMHVSEPEISNKNSTVENDPRITLIGKFIRKHNIDELPQFFNVLKGNMSVVGPRPHRVHLDEELIQVVYNYRIRQCVKPGITGWAQVNGFRGPTDTSARKNGRVEHDLDYIQNWSLWLDIKIIFMTIFGKKTRQNAF